MSKINLISNDWLNIVFADRNKDYGAYEMRRTAPKRFNWAMVIVILIIVAAFLLSALVKVIQASQAQKVDQVTELSALAKQAKKEQKKAKVMDKQPEKKEEPKKVVEKVRSSIKFTAPVIAKDSEVKKEDEFKSQNQLMTSNVAMGAFNVQGNDEGGAVLKAQEAITAPAAPEPETKEEETKVFDMVEQMPSFPGGEGALMEWLNKHIHYPAIAQENGVEGRVIVQFVVGRDGSVSDVNVVRSVDPSLDQEAKRVVRAMPKWIPGKQNGKSVNCKYTLPVTFRLQ